MSILDKVAAALTPPESENARIDARRLARSVSSPNDWLGMVVDHHEQLEGLFDRVKDASTADARLSAQRELGALLTGHSIAEEAVLYPAMVQHGDQGAATMAYTEQQAAKINMFLLENLDPMSQEYLDKLEHIRGAVVHHMYEEEGSRYPSLKQHSLEADQDMLTARFGEEFERYMSGVRAGGQQRFGELPEGTTPAMFRDGHDLPQQAGATSQQRDFAAQMQRDGTRDNASAHASLASTPAGMQMQQHATTDGDQIVGQGALDNPDYGQRRTPVTD